MTKHILHLHPEQFMKVLSGKQRIEPRLYDEKRKLIKPGDTIEFINRLDDCKATREVIGLHLSAGFEELFQTIEQKKLGDESVNDLLEELNEFYSGEQQKQYGVIGIEIRKES